MRNHRNHKRLFLKARSVWYVATLSFSCRELEMYSNRTEDVKEAWHSREALLSLSLREPMHLITYGAS